MKKNIRYHTLDAWLRARHGEKVQKIPLDAGASCPNRDGTLGIGGCIFCNAIGSGSGRGEKNIAQQWDYWRKRFAASDRLKHTHLFLGYLQAFTNTYGSPEQFLHLLEKLRDLPGLIGVCVGTRPDCVDNEKLDIIARHSQPENLPFLANINHQNLMHSVSTHDVPSQLWPEFWLELGIQSCHDATLARINRGHNAATSEDAIRRAAARGIKVCAHLMAGLPGENPDDFLATIRWVAQLPVAGVKLHGLYVCADTPLEHEWRSGHYVPLEHEDYVELIARALTLLPPHIVIHRLVGDPAPGELVAPQWAALKGETIRMLDRMLDYHDWHQGCQWTLAPTVAPTVAPKA